MKRFLPETVEDLVGQEHLFGKGKPLRQMLETEKLYSSLLWGPPGSGKSSFLNVLSLSLKAPVLSLSALDFQLREFQKNFGRGGLFDQPTKVVFLEEIHHLNRRQQDVFLPYLERGEVILFATTTENPYYLLRQSLLSRMQVYSFKPLTKTDLKKLVEKVLAFHGSQGMDPEAMDGIAEMSAGDGRRAVFLTEQLLLLGKKKVTHDELKEISAKRIPYDQKGDAHYQNISAFIKSLRGSDPDAALFYLARMILAGEDPRFIARRMAILASEDIGNADPLALVLASACFDAVEKVGLPEAELILAHTACYLAAAPKSNASYLAWKKAKQAAEEHAHAEVPQHLRHPIAHAGDQDPGWGKDYRYPHAYPEHFVKQQYLPEGVKGPFYVPTTQGKESWIRKRLEQLKKESGNSFS